MIVMDWQPIETTPKDRLILLACRGCTLIGKWNDDRYASRPKPYWTNDSESWLGKLHVRGDQPTHWMPLPKPPMIEE